jgi:hypothetical protein
MHDLRFWHLCIAKWHGDCTCEQFLSKIQHISYKKNTLLTPVNTAIYGRKLMGNTGRQAQLPVTGFAATE